MLPLRGPKGLAASDECVIEPAFFWSPSPDELAGIRAEWERYRDLIRDGHAADLPTSRQTRYIHVRPKAADRFDTDDAPIVGPVIKKCFWLNKGYVASILR